MNDNLIKNYRDMLLMRKFEEKCGQLYGLKKIGGFCHLYIGQEAIAVGIKNCMQQGDSVITSYRAHGVMLALGGNPNELMAELLGKETGSSKGKGGSMHIFDLKNNFFGGHGIVGAQVPIGTGIAFANKLHNKNNVCFTIMGDGAINQGQVYESFNMASLWNLPVVYIIENNGYAMGTSVERGTANPILHKRGESFGINGYSVDGMNLIETTKVLGEATKYCKSNMRPVIVEMKTYRYKGHSMSDAALYRSKEELDIQKDRDPIKHLANIILNEGIANEECLKNIQQDVKKIVQDSVEFAENSKEPEVSELFTDILL